jgi:DNA-directed RNA polymerase alpha subunit
MAKKSAARAKNLRVCAQGHQYYKSSDCPVCPICENIRRPVEEMFSSVGAPARRALENAGIKTAQQLSKYTVEQLFKLHGVGPSSIPKLQNVLESQGLSFKRK